MGESGRVRFGIFDFQPASGELRREGTPVRLQSQPAQVLCLLIQNAGDVVSRETLRQAVWGAETFVDFDRGLNFCVAQIRSALGDSADSPRFIRTIPKRGYQFVAPVGPAQAAAPEMRPPRFARRGLIVAAAGAISLGALGLLGWTLKGRKTPLRVAVARFDNQTGNPDFDRLTDGLTDTVVAELTTAGAGRFEVIGNAAILREPRSNRNLISIASRLGVGYVVLGQVQEDAGRIRVLTHLIALPEQTHLQVIRSDFNAGEPLQAQLETARQVAAEFAVPLAAGQRRRTTSSSARR